MNRSRIRVIVDHGYGVVVDPAQVRLAGWTPGQHLDLVTAVATPVGKDAHRARPAPTRAGRILATVAELGEAYGLQVADQLLAGGKATWWDRWVHPHVHSRLRQLEQGGLLSSREGPPIPERGGRPRVYYRLTPKGETAMEAARGEGMP